MSADYTVSRHGPPERPEERGKGDKAHRLRNTKDMIWKIPRLIEYASHVMTLYPGDLFSTGTPEGVGPLKPGDEVTIELERVGRMSVTVDLRKS